MSRKIQRTECGSSIDVDKVDRLKSFVNNNPDFYKNPGQKGYRWYFVKNLLNNLNEESGFEIIMESKYLSDDEKNYIIFNIYRVKELAGLSYQQFSILVKEFLEIKEGDDV